MNSNRFHSIKTGLSLLTLILSKLSVTLQLITWKRVKNAVNTVIQRQGSSGLLLRRYKAIYNQHSVEIDPTLYIASHHVGDIILFPPIDWEYRFQRPQHLAKQLGLKGLRVFYISMVPVIGSDGKSYVLQANPVAGVILVRLSSGSTHMPDFYLDGLIPNEISEFQKSCEDLCKDFEIASATILVQHPSWWPLICKFTDSRIIYDCLDHHASMIKNVNPVLMSNEQNLVKKASAVIATSDKLAESLNQSTDCHIVRNGCEFDHFAKAACVKSHARPIIGYVGAVSHWFDGQLLFEVARHQADWQFDIYGAMIDTDIRSARSLPNVNFFGEIPYESVPNTIAHFDVGIIPFKINALTLSTNPVKVYEYLACGRPVVATELPELHGMEAIDVFCANSASCFRFHIDRAIKLSDRPDRVKLRQDWASENDWSKRTDQLLALISMK